jgi:hypothetical protein
MTPNTSTSIIRLVDLAVTIRFKRIRPRLRKEGLYGFR